MKTVRIKFGFAHYADSDLGVKAHHIVNSMTGNVNFKTTATATAAVQAAALNYDTALQNLNGDHANTVIKEAARITLQRKLKVLALLILAEAPDDEVALASTGYDQTSEVSGSYGILAAPAEFAVTHFAGTGGVKLACKTVAGAKSYSFEYTETPATSASVWHRVSSSKKSCRIDGLTIGKEYAFRVAAVGTATTLTYSASIIRVVN